MKIVADQNIPLLEELLPEFQIHRLPGRAIRRADLTTADALLVRSVTRVDRRLLEDTSVRFVGTATAGTDHVNLVDLENLGIGFAAAPGANARTVVEYLLCVLASLGRDLHSTRFGIVGCGQVGGRLYRLLADLGCAVQVYDPLLDAETSPCPLATLDEVLCADLVTLHTPLTDSGPYPTRHMLGPHQIEQMAPGAVLVNSSRGGVVDEAGLLARPDLLGRIELVLDVWEGEPRVPEALLRACRLMSPHVAGYSGLAKERGARAVVAALLGRRPDIGEVEAESLTQLRVESWQQAALQLFDPALAKHRLIALSAAGESFDALRQSYGERLEFSQVALDLPDAARSMARKLGFLIL